MKRDTFNRIFPRLKGAESARGPMIAADHLAFLLEQPLEKVCTTGELLAEGLLKAQKLYRTDFLIVFSDVAVEPEAMGVKLQYYPDKNPQPLNHIPPDKIGKVGMPASGRLPELFKAADICREKLGENFPIFISMKDPFSLAAMTTGTEDFLASLLTKPSQAHKILEICLENQICLIRAIIKRGFIPFVGAPIATGDMIGPRFFREFTEPYLIRLFEASREMDSFACLHICGSVNELMERLEKPELDILSLEDAEAISRWKLLPNTIPMGYVDTNLFVYGDTEKIKNETLRCKAAMSEPYILSTGCDLPAKAKPELVKAMMEVG